MTSALQSKRSAVEQLLLPFAADDSHAPSCDQPGSVRRVVVANEVVGYRLQRVQRRSIGLQVDETGLTIRAPRWITLREIEAAVVENLRWIRRKQSEWRDQHLRHQTDVRADGGTLQYLGRTITLRLGADRVRFEDEAALWLALPVDTAPSDVSVALAQWLQQQANIVFADRIERFSGRIDSRFAGWQLSSARTQWGSCSPQGRIRLNWRLVQFAVPIIDYVIAHELAHLTELNHSARFWATVAYLLPGFEAARDQIKRVPMPRL